MAEHSYHYQHRDLTVLFGQKSYFVAPQTKIFRKCANTKTVNLILSLTHRSGTPPSLASFAREIENHIEYGIFGEVSYISTNQTLFVVVTWAHPLQESASGMFSRPTFNQRVK